MEAHDDRQQKDEAPRDGKERKRRFRIVKLEERIAPGANNTHGHCSGALDCIRTHTCRCDTVGPGCY